MKTNQDIKNKKYLHHEKVYAGFDETKDCFIYIGGRYYDDVAQIHLSKTEAAALRVWLNKALRRRKPKTKKQPRATEPKDKS